LIEAGMIRNPTAKQKQRIFYNTLFETLPDVNYKVCPLGWGKGLRSKAAGFVFSSPTEFTKFTRKKKLIILYSNAARSGNCMSFIRRIFKLIYYSYRKLYCFTLKCLMYEEDVCGFRKPFQWGKGI
jgi:hypothetical protein